MQYQECDLKTEQTIVNQEDQTITTIPSREDSLERLAEQEVQFAGEAESVEETVLRKLQYEQLHKALSLLLDDERELIDRLFFQGQTERQARSAWAYTAMPYTSARTAYMDGEEGQTVIFAYPKLFTGVGTLQVIWLEIGALAAWTPARPAEIVPYAAEHYPDVFGQRGTDILTVAPERTFWEKATILHHEANRLLSQGMGEVPGGSARHHEIAAA